MGRVLLPLAPSSIFLPCYSFKVGTGYKVIMKLNLKNGYQFDTEYQLCMKKKNEDVEGEESQLG